MLTKEHSICGFDRGCLVPDCLDKRLDAAYVEFAEQMLALYRCGIGQTLGELRCKVERIFDREEGCHPRRIKAFIKILEDASDFEIANEVEKPWKLRLKVFKMAGEKHPLVKIKEELHEHSAEQVKTEIADKLARHWSEIEANLYADVLDFHVLKKFKGPALPQELLAEYNVAQAQAALLKAVEIPLTKLLTIPLCLWC